MDNDEAQELDRIARNHAVLVRLLERIAEKAYVWRHRRNHPHVRAQGHGIRDDIRQALDELEIDDGT